MSSEIRYPKDVLLLTVGSRVARSIPKMVTKEPRAFRQSAYIIP